MCSFTFTRMIGTGAMAALVGCGGGGGGTGGPDDVDEIANPPSDVVGNPQRVTIEEDYEGEPAQSVPVAVLDAPLDLSHDEFTGTNGLGDPVIRGGVDANVAMSAAYPSLFDSSGSSDVSDFTYSDGDSDHGQPVSSIVAGANVGYSGNATVYHSLITRDDDTANTNVINYALGDAAEASSFVANLSYGPFDPVSEYARARRVVDSMDSSPNDGFADIGSSVDSYSEMRLDRLRAVRDAGMAVVVGAGNESASLTTNYAANRSWAPNNPLIDQTVFVGALEDDGKMLADFSNYPGVNELVASRFLVAPGSSEAALPGDDRYARFSGTSAAAPVVTAAAATVKAYWSFMTPEEVLDRLLETTDTGFNAQWERNDCGPNGATNCGRFYYGQGRLNLDAALAPEGNLTIPTGDEVPDAESRQQAAAVNRTVLAVPASLDGMARTVRAASAGVQAFDDLGRNYTLDMAPAVTTSVKPGRRLDQRLGGAANDLMDDTRNTEAFGGL